MKKLLLFLLHALITVLLWQYFSTVDSSTQEIIQQTRPINNWLIPDKQLINGQPEYNSYLNNKYAVTPENNMAIPLISLLGIS
ncbi:MAG: hypothetical protein GY951_08565, partial [Psychromonas sp.]|nr:hypothetical protein [Psychromonas sp.]